MTWAFAPAKGKKLGERREKSYHRHSEQLCHILGTQKKVSGSAAFFEDDAMTLSRCNASSPATWSIEGFETVGPGPGKSSLLASPDDLGPRLPPARCA